LRRFLVLVATVGLAAAPGALGVGAPAKAAQQTEPDAVARIGDYVERYYATARSLVADETVTLIPLSSSFTFSRRLAYELRLDWDPTAEEPAKVSRQLLTINGRAPRPNAKPECLDPHDVAPEPMAFLLPDRRHKYTFKSAGLNRLDGRPAIVIDYRSRTPEPPKATWRAKGNPDCMSVDVPGRTRGRIWANPVTFEILRLDEGLTGEVDIRVPVEEQRRSRWPMTLTLKRADVSIRYKEVMFQDPEERVMVPSEITTNTEFGSRRLMTQQFSNYRRFTTGARIIE
jgi:hypothetical protein